MKMFKLRGKKMKEKLEGMCQCWWCLCHGCFLVSYAIMHSRLFGYIER